MSGLHLVRLRPRPARLAAFAATTGTLPRGEDLGYAIHLALRRALGAAAPQPFRWMEATGDLLGYAADGAALADAAGLPPTDAAAADARDALGIESLETKAMPAAWRADSRYGFEIRLRPVRRTGREKRAADRPGEHDAFGTALRGLPADAARPVARDVYLAWARDRIEAEGVVRVVDLRLTAMARSEVVRRIHDGSGRVRRFDGPDVTVAGTIVVVRPDAMTALLARGIGRHRAFGFGMLLLRPAGRS